MSEKLAIHGGTPVRDIPMPPSHPGASVYGELEAKAAQEVILAKAPFRYYGPAPVLGKVREFESGLSQKIGTKYTLGVTSGTASLVVALKAAGIGAGDKVIIPACTFIATAGAVVSAGAVPVFCDIDESFSIDPEKIKDCVDPYTKAVITVPILGNPCQMDRIMEEAKKYNLIVIEDVAQSMGSKYQGRYSGSFGDIGCFSLQVNKVLSTGEGGAVSTNDPMLYERAVRYHDHGMFREREGFLSTNSADDIFLGQNYRMSEVTGAVACAQLTRLDDLIAHMKKIKNMILDGIRGIPGLDFIRINDEEGDCGNSIIMLLPDKEKAMAFIQAMGAENVACGHLYNGEPIYMVPQLLYKRTVDKNGFPFNQFDHEIEYTPDMCPQAVKLMARNALLSIGGLHTEKDAEDAIRAVRKVAAAIL